MGGWEGTAVMWEVEMVVRVGGDCGNVGGGDGSEGGGKRVKRS